MKSENVRLLASTDSLDPVWFISAYQNLLVSLPLCAGIPLDLLVPFLLKCEYRSLEPQDQLLSPGQVNQYLYVVVSGQLSAHVNAIEWEKGFRLLPGELVGEVSIIDNLLPTAYVTATQTSLLLCIHETVLWSDFILIPGAARNMLLQIMKRVRARNLAVQKAVEQNLRLEHLEKELQIAQDLQASMLPQQPLFPSYPQIEVDAMMKPAKEIGGDFFDAFELDAGRICVAIGDVAGKGVPAALFMVRSITVLRTEMLRSKDLLQTITAMNVALSQDNPQCMFVTLMICVLDVCSGQLQYVNGGHNRPLLGNSGNRFCYLEQPAGILVGINPYAIYQTSTLYLQPMDTFILYTDGVTEANNPAQDEFTEPRLLDFINRQGQHSASGIVTEIYATVQDFASGAEQSDDLTLLVLRYLGS
ncbi:MAG: SpoIIE family protein phosphatase [Methylovulum sp.]|jgi:sigma-B regulation protein RsbU (phosphoserine phosphatase)|nr:SpoIIE family protein phosphatase [Methylovulum sp.]MCF7999298.1 SpoIIE family protein phosphatase [Methylovulum sp.]